MGRIARLEVENFKSYGGVHVIGPFKRFTAVIGPNGAGKSNLMDAISFVLGVHSRQLRSNQLKDLIHKPPAANDSAALSASVTLVYELDANEIPSAQAHQELLFTRLISDKGVGSYRVNRIDVNAETYQQQLKDIGILVKARNFLVFQGDVESVAAKSPEELTKFFEQISTSDELRDEYDRLLEEKNAAEENAIFAYQKKKGLVVEKKMVREQKEEAEAFRTKRQELHELRAEHCLWQLFQTHESAQRHRTALHAAQNELRAFDAAEDEDAQAYRAKRKAHSLALRELSASRAKVQEVQSELDAVAPRVIRVREQTKYAQRKITEAESAVASLRKRLGGQTSEIRALQSDLADLAVARDELEAQQSGTDGSAAEQSLLHDTARLDEYYRLKETAQIKTNLLRSELDAVLRQQRTDANKVQTLTHERDENAKICAMLADDMKIADDRISSMWDVIAQTERAIIDSEEDIRHAETDLEGQAERKTKLKEKLARVDAKLRDLKDDKRQSQTDSRRNEMIETLRRLFPGVRGRLVDLCKPVQRKYNMAVTVATGKHMDAIVVVDIKTAQDCIVHLRDARLGTAVFIPLDTIRIKPLNERFRNLGDSIKLIVDVVQCDAEIEPALRYAVGDAVVCDTIDTARTLCFDRGEKVKAVTLDGMVVSKSGSMTGGRTSGDNARAGRWDDKEIDVLQTKRDALNDELRALEAHGGGYARMQTLRTQLEGLQNRLRYAQADLAATEDKKPKLQQRIDEATRRITQRLEPELQTVERAVSARQDAIATLQQQIHGVEDDVFAAFSKQMGVASIRVYEDTVLTRKQKAVDMRRRIREHMTKLQAQIDYLTAQDLDAPLQDAVERAAHEQQRLRELATQEHALERSVAALTQQHKDAQTKFAAQSRAMDALEAELKGLGTGRAATDAARSELLARIAAAETALARLRDRRAAILMRASLEHVTLPVRDATGDVEMVDAAALSALSLSESPASSTAGSTSIEDPEDRTTTPDFDALPDDAAVAVADDRELARLDAAYVARIAAVVADLERMQPNLRALEQFETIQSRLATEEDALELVQQQSLAAATAFDQVRAARTERFLAAFTHVAGRIDATYKALTMSAKHPLGGTAYLSLENPDEPFAGGITYSAMPPMKRFRDIEQLSGGEKSVAALALLFAVHQFQPSPFFVLDEVDAALDNVNVNKLSHYIARCDFQCIVISLKDAFYEKAEALVGVCKDIAQQRSQALTLDLTQYDE